MKMSGASIKDVNVFKIGDIKINIRNASGHYRK